MPLGTRCWSRLIGTLAVLSQIGLLQPEQVAVDAHAIVKQLQIWRPVTAASFLGGLGPQLIQKLYYLISYGRQLEATLGLGEYLRVLASLAAALTRHKKGDILAANPSDLFSYYEREPSTDAWTGANEFH